MTTEQAPPGAGRKEWTALAVLALPTLVLSIDMSVLNLALPYMSEDLGTDSVEQLWSIDIYGFMVAGFLITMGTLGDRIGRRKLLLIGAACFAVASVLAAFSSSPAMLIASRAVMGIAGATLAPSTLALILNMFHRNPKQLGTAIGLWTGCFFGGLVLGPIVGGAMLHFFWWGSVFLVAVPVMVLLLVVGPILLPEFKSPDGGRLDLFSVALSLAAILPVIYGIKELAKDGWEVVPIVTVVVGLAFGVLFVIRQRRLASPLMDLRLFGNRSFSAALLINLVGAVIGGGTVLVINLYLQMVAGLTPLEAGLWTVPSGLAMVATATSAPAIARRMRPAYVIACGLSVAAAGYVLLVFLDSVGGLAVAIIGVIITSAGSGPQAALTTNLVLANTPPEKAGSAASLSETCGQLGLALGAAIMGSVATAVYDGQLSDGVPAEAHESIVSAVAVLGGMPGEQSTQLLNNAREAFTSGVNIVAGISAVLLIGLAILGSSLLRHVPATSSGAPTQEPADDGEGAVHTVG